MTNIDAVGAPAPPPPPPCTSPKVELEVEKALLTLKHDCQCRLTINVTPESCPVTAYKIEIQKASGGSWFLLSDMRNYAWTARVAGKFKIRGTATVNGSDVQSDLKDVEVQFPTYDQLLEKPAKWSPNGPALPKAENAPAPPNPPAIPPVSLPPQTPNGAAADSHTKNPLDKDD